MYSVNENDSKNKVNYLAGTDLTTEPTVVNKIILFVVDFPCHSGL